MDFLLLWMYDEYLQSKKSFMTFELYIKTSSWLRCPAVVSSDVFPFSWSKDWKGTIMMGQIVFLPREEETTTTDPDKEVHFLMVVVIDNGCFMLEVSTASITNEWYAFFLHGGSFNFTQLCNGLSDRNHPLTFQLLLNSSVPPILISLTCPGKKRIIGALWGPLRWKTQETSFLVEITTYNQCWFW